MAKKQTGTLTDAAEKGIESLKDAIKFLLMSVQEISNADRNSDGKVGWMEGLLLVKNVGLKIPSILKQIPEIRDEWKDLSPAELDELVAWFTDEFDIPGLEHERIEKIIEISAAVLVYNYHKYREIRDLFGA